MLFGEDLRPPLAHRVERGADDLRRIHEPLVGEVGLDRDLRAVAMGDHVAVGVDAVEPAFLLATRTIQSRAS
jgi:hypothetical protein